MKAGSRQSSKIAFLLWLIPLGFLALFYFFPLGKILAISFGRAGTPELWAALLSKFDVLWFTLWQAALSTALTLLVGLPGAYILAHYTFRGKAIFRAVTGIPFVMPTLVVAAGFNALLGPQGWANSLLIEWFDLSAPPIQFLNSLTAIISAHVFYNLTIVLRLVGDYWARLDPRLTQAAQTLGANRWQTLKRVTLPLLAPAILAAGLLIFIFDFSSFAVVLVLGGPKFATLEVEIFYQTSALFNLPLAAALSLLQLFCTLGLTIIYTRLSARVARPVKQQSQVTLQRRLPQISKRGRGSLIARSTPWLLRLTLLVILLFTILPLLALAARSLTHLGPARADALEPGLTFQFYQTLWEHQSNSVVSLPAGRAILVSLGYAATTVAVALTLGLPAAWALARQRHAAFNQFIDPILMLPLGTSAVTLGLGFIVAFNQPPFHLAASPLLIPLAHTLVAFPFVVRSLTPALQSIQPQLRRAAAVLGASPMVVMRQIDLPLVARALLVSAIFAFTISLGEFGATALIARPEFPTVPMVIYRLLGRPGALNYGQALALSTILMLVTTSGMLVIEKFRVGAGEF